MNTLNFFDRIARYTTYSSLIGQYPTNHIVTLNDDFVWYYNVAIKEYGGYMKNISLPATAVLTLKETRNGCYMYNTAYKMTVTNTSGATEISLPIPLFVGLYTSSLDIFTKSNFATLLHTIKTNALKNERIDQRSINEYVYYYEKHQDGTLYTTGQTIDYVLFPAPLPPVTTFVSSDNRISYDPIAIPYLDVDIEFAAFLQFEIACKTIGVNKLAATQWLFDSRDSYARLITSRNQRDDVYVYNATSSVF